MRVTHVLNFAYNALVHGTCLETELRRNDVVLLDIPWAPSPAIPDPPTPVTSAALHHRRRDILQNVFASDPVKVGASNRPEILPTRPSSI